MKAVADRSDKAGGADRSSPRATGTADHDTDSAAGLAVDAEAASAATEASRRFTPRGLLRLQRSAGNAAVVQRLAEAHPSPPPAPVPADPHADPRFTKVTGKVDDAAGTLRAHPAAAGEAKKASAAAPAPAGDKLTQANASQADKMNAAKPAGFDKAAFIAAVKAAVAAKAPKNLDEADSFASSGKADGVRSEVMGQVTKGKETSAKDVADKTNAAPDTSTAKDKPVTPLTQDTVAKPTPPAAGAGMPAPAPPEQTDLGAGKAETDAQMAEADVTEEQLAKSNEPEFTGALAAKKAGEEHSATAPGPVREGEAATLQAAAGGADKAAVAAVGQMVGAKTTATTEVGNQKEGAKTAETAARTRINAKVDQVFNATQTDVRKILTDLDTAVGAKFDEGEKVAKAAFTADHKARMERYKDARYSGFTGKLRWVKDKFAGLPAEANELFQESRKLYESKMEGVISAVADIVGKELARAKARIAQGRQEITTFLANEPKELASIVKEATGKVGAQFGGLESEVDDKQSQLVDDLAERYVTARNAVDEEIKALQDENKGLWDKAKEAVGGAISTILKLKDMLTGVLARAAGAIGKIIRDPIGFLGNLINAVKSGVMGFAANIVGHLKSGLQGWLFGALGSAGIEIPESFDLKGIIKLVLSILGLTWTRIRTKIVKRIGEAAMGAVEKGVDIFQTLVSEGVGGLWKFLIDKLSDLKDTVMSAIQDFVVVKIVKAGITWLISALNPAAAFIKACKMIYDVVMFFVEKGSQIKEFVDSVLDSIESIVGGGVGAVAKHIEGTLAKILPLLLGFLASLLGLGGISEKIREILEKVQKPVEKAVDFVVNGALKLARPIINLVKRGAGWVKGKFEKGKAWVKGKVEQGKAWAKGKVDTVKGKLGLGDKEEEQKPPAGPEEEPTGDIHGDVARDMDAALGGGVDPERVPAVVDTVYARHQPRGLKSLETRPKEDAPGEFEVYVQASPLRRVTVFRTSDLQLSFPRTACIVHVTHRGETENLGKFISGRGPAGATEHHAEQRMIPILTDRYFTSERPKGKYAVQLSLTRSPCDVCGPKLEGFKDVLAGRGFNTSFTVRFASAYGGSSDADTIRVLSSLRAHGFKLEALSLEQIVSEELLNDPARPLTDEDKAKLADKLADAKAALRKATVKRGA